MSIPKNYLERLTRAARWRLPKAEADEVVADYQELFAEETRPAEELCRDLGDPGQAVRVLGQTRAYGTWLAVFGVLVLALASLVLVGVSGWRFQAPWCYQISFLLFAVGLGLSLAWFFWSDRTKGRKPLPKGLLPLMLLVFCAACAVLLALWFCMAYLQPVLYWAQDRLPPYQLGPLVHALFQAVILMSAVAGAFGLVRARLFDRRWRALYTLGLTAAALCLLVLSVLRGLSLDLTRPGWWIPYLWRGMGIAAAGLAATGVSLC